jgi:hypothetical protein
MECKFSPCRKTGGRILSARPGFGLNIVGFSSSGLATGRLIIRSGLTIADRSHNLLCDTLGDVRIIPFPCIVNLRSSSASEQITLRMGKDDWYECGSVGAKREIGTF